MVVLRLVFTQRVVEFIMDKKWFVVGAIVGFVVMSVFNGIYQYNAMLDLAVEACDSVVASDDRTYNRGMSECVYRSSGQIYKYSCEVPDVPNLTECFYDARGLVYDDDV